MYSAFCRNLRNYLKQYNDPATHMEYRYRVMEPFTLLLDAANFNTEKANQTYKYKKVVDFLAYAQIHKNTSHQLPTLLRELEDYGITPQHQGIVSEEDLQEQLKIVNMFMKLMYYWGVHNYNIKPKWFDMYTSVAIDKTPELELERARECKDDYERRCNDE